MAVAQERVDAAIRSLVGRDICADCAGIFIEILDAVRRPMDTEPPLEAGDEAPVTDAIDDALDD